MEKYMDQTLSPQERAQDLLEKMSLEEKIRQLGCTMVIPAIPMEYQDLSGGIGVSIVMGVNDDYADALEKVQKYIMEQSPHHIPALFHGEAVSYTHLVCIRDRPYTFPSASIMNVVG